MLDRIRINNDNLFFDVFMPIFLFFMSLVIDPLYKKRLNEIVPVSHPTFWFGTILAQKSNNKNYSHGVNRILTIKIIPTMPKPIK